jgi:hypothetical protein
MTSNPLKPSQARFRVAFNRIERHIETRYGIPVRVRDVPEPFTGDLDGAEIHVDYDQQPEDGLAIIAHLFGHTVQWNLSERGRTLGVQAPDQNISPQRLQELYDYELEAARYSLQLFHEAGLDDLDQWLSDYFHCDWRYLEHFYRSGEKRPFFSFWQSGGQRISALAIPAFEALSWRSRFGGIVL